MKEKEYTEQYVIDNLDNVLDEIEADNDLIIIIKRESGKDVALISVTELKAQLEIICQWEEKI